MKKVSVLITTYNHENYIAQCIESVLRQQTNFDFEILIGEDDSSDATRKICQQYAQKFPEKIKLFLNKRKDVIHILGKPTGRRNFVQLLKKANGQYLARCEGDDYWTDVHKLQKMVDFLDRHSDYMVAFHRVARQIGNQLQPERYLPPGEKEVYQITDLFQFDNFIRTSSVIFRNLFKGKIPEWVLNVPFGDITFNMLHAQQGKIKYFKEEMGVYRVHDKGVYSGETSVSNLFKAILTYQILAEKLGFLDHPAFKAGQLRLLKTISQQTQKAAQRIEQELKQHSNKDLENAAVKGDPLVSVILPTYNRPEGLYLALQSLTRQTYQNFEVVVINDAGENVQWVVDSFKNSLKIKYIVHEQNQDLAGARNTGLKNAAGSYIAYLDDDDIFFPNHLKEALRILTNTPYQVVYSDAFRLHQQKEGYLYAIKHVDLPYSNPFSKERLLMHNLFPVISVVHAKSCLEKTGFFDTSLHTHEDWDFFIRLSRFYDFYHLKKITCAFSMRYDSSNMTTERKASFAQTTEMIYRKYQKWAQNHQQILNFQKNHLGNLKKQLADSKRTRATVQMDLQGPLVSIVIPVFNQLEYTKKCLNAIFKNTRYAPFEIVVVNNGSSDGTTDFLQSLQSKTKNLKVVQNKTNLGFARACNQGARVAAGTYLVFLNNDTEVQPYWLVKLFETAHNDPQVGAVGAKLLYPDGSVQHAGVLITRDERNGNPLAPWHIHLGKNGNDARVNVPYRYQAVTGACMLLKKEDFVVVNGFDENYHNGYEDVDLCFKLGQLGKTIVYQPAARVIHYESKSGALRFARMEQNKKRLHQKWLNIIKPDNWIMPDGKVKFLEPAQIGPYPATNSYFPEPPALGNKRIKIGYLSLDQSNFACPTLRLEWPLRYLEQQNKIQHVTVEPDKVHQTLPVEQLRSLDILIVQRNMAAALPIEKLKTAIGQNGPKIVYEIDDALDRLPADYPAAEYYQNMRQNIIDYLRQADLVTVASPVLKKYYESYNPSIVVLPNTLIKEIWLSQKHSSKRKSKKVRLLFAGTNSHANDFQLIEPVLERILTEQKERVELLFWADIPTKLEKLTNFKRISAFLPDYYEYAQKLKSLSVDIALVPLANHAFNQAKTPIKWLEYSACRIAGVYSQVEPYARVVESGKNGLLVTNEAESWYTALMDLIDHPQKRKQLAKKAYRQVWAKYDLEKHVHLWYKAYQQVLKGQSTVPERNASDQKDQPLVSIIIPTYNKLELTKICLSSIFENTAGSFEVIVVDNGSSDGTKAYLKKLQKTIPALKTIFNDQNRGFAAANNQAAQKARGKYLVFLNNDTRVFENWLAALVQVVEKDPQVGAVGSKLIFPDGTIQHAGVVIVENRQNGDPLLAVHRFYKQPARNPETNQLMFYQALTAASSLVRKDLFDRLNGFDEKFWNGYEDIDLCFRIQKAGFGLVYQPNSVALHYESQSGPERWSSVKQNIRRLHQKWLGKIQPDFIIEPNGQQIKNATHIRPYSLNSKNKEPLISIIMLTYNALDYTKRCVQSLFQYTNLPFEIVFVDNGSRDGTVAYLKQLKQTHPNVTLILNRTNKGFSAGNNQGAQKAKGKYLVFLNNDVLVSDGWLEDLLTAFEKDPQIGMVGPVTNSISGLQRLAEIPYNDESGFHHFAARVRQVNKEKITPRRRLAGFCLLTSKAIFESVGGFDESFGTGNFEDDDLSIRIRQKGYALMVHEGVFIHHYGSQTFKANHMHYEQNLKEKARVFFQKHPHVDYEELLELKNPIAEVHAGWKQEIEQALQKQDWPKVLTLSEKILQENPLEDEVWFYKAHALRFLNKVEQAKQAINQILLHDSQNAVALNFAGELLMQEQKFKEAQSLFQKAVQFKPAFIEAHRNLAHLFIENGKFEQGISILQKILQQQPKDIPTLIYFANLYLEVENFTEAANYLFKVLQLDAHNDLAKQMWQLIPASVRNGYQVQFEVNDALQALNMGEAQKAKKTLEPIVKKQPNNIEALYGYALALQMLNDLDGAKQQLLKVLQIEPNFTLALNDLGRIEFIEGHYLEAKNYFETSLKIDEQQTNVKNQLSEVLFALNDYQNGVELLINTLKENPDDLETLKHLAHLYQEIGQQEQARALWQKVKALNPHDTDVQAVLG